MMMVSESVSSQGEGYGQHTHETATETCVKMPLVQGQSLSSLLPIRTYSRESLVVYRYLVRQIPRNRHEQVEKVEKMHWHGKSNSLGCFTCVREAMVGLELMHFCFNRRCGCCCVLNDIDSLTVLCVP